MSVIVLEDNKKHLAEPSVDINGNLYLEINKETYQICVDKKNNPYCDKGDYTILETPTINTGILKDTSNPYSLKGNTVAKIKKEKEQMLNELEEVDDELEYIDFLDHKSKYFIEDDDCFEDYKNEQHDNDSDTEYDQNLEDTSNIIESFKFLKTPQLNIPIHKRNNGDFNALYDIIIREGDLTKSKICFKTRLFLGNTAHYTTYRLQLYNSGHCTFREIGGKDRTYVLKLNKNELELIPS